MLALLSLTAAITLGQAAQPAETFFELRIRPVLARSCFKCHGSDKVSGGLRLDSRASLLRGGESGPTVVPGDPDNSLLLRALRHAGGGPHMPPAPNKKLTAEVVADFAKWVKGGAPWPASASAPAPSAAVKHWAFQPVKAQSPPADPTGWAVSPIDRLIMAGLREHGLKPIAPVDRRTLLRRATFDLIGLPPTPEEMNAFLADCSPGAFARVVDRLLASPRYGERWGRHWLDVARYADTAGDNADYPIPEIHRYRDYVIDAFNADMPFDQFVREQLAGDILAAEGPPEKYDERVVATGFLALSRRYATAPYEFWHLTLEDAIDTTGAAFLGLTLRCARCHDHKYDPVTQRDYYGLYGIYAATTFPYAGSEEFASMNKGRRNFTPLLPPAEAEPRLKPFRERLEKYEQEIAQLKKELRGPNADTQRLRTRLKEVQSEFRPLNRSGLPADVPGAYAVSEGKPVETRIHKQGDPDRPGAVVPRGVPAFLDGGRPVEFPAAGSGRLQFARWLTRPDHPLTARVLVNRVWQHHFGRGLVGTPNNFGVRGESPTHPDLLDFLAAEFVRDGWSIKRLHRRILLSKTYQMSCADDPDNASRDPGNRWRWRFDRRRLDAEALRDAMLFVSGRLDLRRPGPHPFPPMEKWGWTQHNPFKDVYPSNHRSVYLMTQRIQRHPYLALFDGPDPNASTGKRTTATVPSQALYLMNHPFVREQAQGLARRLISASNDEGQRVVGAHRRAWGRPPEQTEIEKGIGYVRRYAQALAEAGAPSDRVELEAWTSYARVLLTANEFVYVD